MDLTTTERNNRPDFPNPSGLDLHSTPATCSHSGLRKLIITQNCAISETKTLKSVHQSFHNQCSHLLPLPQLLICTSDSPSAAHLAWLPSPQASCIRAYTPSDGLNATLDQCVTHSSMFRARAVSCASSIRSNEMILRNSTL